MLDDDFKYLTEKVGSKNLEPLKPKKNAYLYEYMDILKKFREEKLPELCITAP